MSIEIREIPLPDDPTSLFRAVPELLPIPREVVMAKVGASPLLVVAEVAGEIVGFKLGYALTPEVFYSWIGGVAPRVRQGGVGRRLLRFQEEMAQGRSHTILRVKSMNKFPAMLRLLIGEGYQVMEIDRDGPGEPKIVFEKRL